MPLKLETGRRWFRISIRSLMLLIFILCVWLAIWTTRARRQEEAVRRLIDAGATVRYRHEFDAGGNPIPNPIVLGPKWLRNIFGNQAFWTVYSVDVGSSVALRDEDLQPLEALRDVEVLRLGPRTTDAGLAHVAGLVNLKSLQTEGVQITNHGLNHLANLQRLESLSIGDSQVDDDGLRLLASLEQLTYINLLRTLVTTEGVEWLKQRLPKAYIDAACPSHDDEKEIARKLSKLGTRVDVGSDGWISGVELVGPAANDEALNLAEGLRHLGGVRMRNAGVSPSAINRLREQHPNILIVPKYPAKVADDAEVIAQIQKLDCRISFDASGYIQRLDIEGQVLADDGLAPLEKLSHLTGLFIYLAAVDDSALKHIARLPNLTMLGINNYQASDDGLESLSGLVTLQWLTLQGGAITDSSLAKLAKLKSLTVVYLIDSQVQGPGLQQLQDLPDLLFLEGRKSAIRDDGLRYLSGFHALKRLSLYSTSITDNGLIHLEKLDTLEVLSLMNTKVTDAGIAHLQNLKKLKLLNVKNTAVTKDGVEQFLKHVPKCEVIY